MKTTRRRLVRWSKGRVSRVTDTLAVEEPLEIRVQTRPISVTMRTPGHDEELAVGFLVSEGLLRVGSDLASVRRDPHRGRGNVVQVLLAPGVDWDPTALTRHVFASSSCGLCGKASIASVRKGQARIRGAWTLRAEDLEALPEKLRITQEAFAETGGLHAAALFTGTGELEVVREDVGRHNAVDKVVGWAWMAGKLPLENHGLLVSGRASFEIVQKAGMAGVAIVAAVSAPSSLAVDLARRNGQTLVGFLRDGRFNVYAGEGRIGLKKEGS
jgi:FdhD protein